MTNLEKLLALKNAHLSEIVQGPQGVQGPKGEQGAQGVQGPQGVPGVQGPKGDDGSNGVGIQLLGTVATIANLPAQNNTQGDTYIVTANEGHGYTWMDNLAAWLDIGQIRGPQGEQGLQGNQGEVGPVGPEGPEGAQGVQGIQGPQGIQGVQGVSANIETLTNRTGGVSVKGTVVCASSTHDLAVAKIIVNDPDPFGVILEDGIADGDLVKVVMYGIAEVLFIGNTTRGHFARGFITGDAGYIAGYVLSEAVPSPPLATDKHFYEIGHVLQSRVGPGLVKVALHFN